MFACTQGIVQQREREGGGSLFIGKMVYPVGGEVMGLKVGVGNFVSLSICEYYCLKVL